MLFYNVIAAAYQVATFLARNLKG